MNCATHIAIQFIERQRKFIFNGRFVNRPYKEPLNHTVGADIIRPLKNGSSKIADPYKHYS